MRYLVPLLFLAFPAHAAPVDSMLFVNILECRVATIKPVFPAAGHAA